MKSNPRLWKEKKGTILLYLVVLGFIGALVMSWLASTQTGLTGNTFYIGEAQLRLMETYQRGEEMLFYIDQSAAMVVPSSLFELASRGGHLNSPCGEFYGYEKLSNSEEVCLPSRPDISLGNIFGDILDEFMKSHPSFPIGNYDILVKEGTDGIDVIGQARQYLVLDLTTQGIVSSGAINNVDVQPVAGEGDYIWPLGKESDTHFIVTSCHGERTCDHCQEKFHTATDIAGSIGDYVLAVADGTVTSVGGGYNKVEIKHKDDIITGYLHNDEILVSEGDKVTQGQPIARLGGRGPKGREQYKPHLHYYMIDGGQKIDVLEPGYKVYDIEKMELKFMKSANCCYNSDKYSYQEKLEPRCIA